MPRYYFNLLSDSSEAIDVAGRACADDLDALGEAMRAASEVVRRRLPGEGFTADGWIEVEDERHRPVLRLPLRAAAY